MEQRCGMAAAQHLFAPSHCIPKADGVQPTPQHLKKPQSHLLRTTAGAQTRGCCGYGTRPPWFVSPQSWDLLQGEGSSCEAVLGVRGSAGGAMWAAQPPLPAVFLSLPNGIPHCRQRTGQPHCPAAFPPPISSPPALEARQNQAAELRSDTASPALHLGAVKAVLCLQPGGPQWLNYPKAAPRVGLGGLRVQCGHCGNTESWRRGWER